MANGVTELRGRQRARLPIGVWREQWRARSRQPHHRRRRALAAGTALLAAVLVWGLIGSASHGHGHPTAADAAAHGFLGPLAILAAQGPGSLADREQLDEGRAIDRVLAYTPYVRIAGSQHREIALTFDDGPGPYTPKILASLSRLHAPATFFEVGVLERYFHASTSDIVTDGDTIGDHTETHAAMGLLRPRDQRTQLLEQIAAVGQYGAPFPRLFRPPYGSWDAATLKMLHRFRMLMVLWTVDTNDYRRPGVGAIVHSALSGARPGAIILLHDAGGDRRQTVAALPRIVRGLRARGYRLVTVPRLLLDNPPPRDQEIKAVVGTGA